LPAGDQPGRHYLRLAAADGLPGAIKAACLELGQLTVSGEEAATVVTVPNAAALAALQGQLGERLRAVLPLAE
jgi:hypothetical protein